MLGRVTRFNSAGRWRKFIDCLGNRGHRSDDVGRQFRAKHRGWRRQQCRRWAIHDGWAGRREPGNWRKYFGARRERGHRWGENDGWYREHWRVKQCRFVYGR